MASPSLNGCVPTSVHLVQGSICRSVLAGETDEVRAPAAPSERSEDEVVGLYPVTEVDSTALRRQADSASLALHLHWKLTADEQGSEPQHSVAASLGRVSLVYPAGLASDVRRFLARSRPAGQSLDRVKQFSLWGRHSVKACSGAVLWARCTILVVWMMSHLFGLLTAAVSCR